MLQCVLSLCMACDDDIAHILFVARSFFAWTEIQEYRNIPTVDYQRGMAMHIYQKYIKEHAILQVSARALQPDARPATSIMWRVLQLAHRSTHQSSKAHTQRA
jgi:hypothetical protein